MTTSAPSVPTTGEEVMAILNGAPAKLPADIDKQLTDGKPTDRNHAIWFLGQLFHLQLNASDASFQLRLTFGRDYDQNGQLTANGQTIVHRTMPYLDIEAVEKLSYSNEHNYLKLPLKQVARYIAWKFRLEMALKNKE